MTIHLRGSASAQMRASYGKNQANGKEVNRGQCAPAHDDGCGLRLSEELFHVPAAIWIERRASGASGSAAFHASHSQSSRLCS